MDSRGGQGILLGQIASNISLVWSQENDKIQHVLDSHVDEGEVSLNGQRKPLFTYTNQQADSSPLTEAGKDRTQAGHGDVELCPA